MNKLLFVLITLLCFSLYTEKLYGIPAFARKYKMSCQTCHSPVPRLKAFGDEFAGNGFVLADQDAPRYFVDTGDPELSLIRDFPIAVRLDAFVTYNNRDTKQTDFTVPYLLKLLSGGSLSDNIAYYFYAYLSERGEVVGVEDAYLMFNNLLGSELDLYIGQFQVSDPLFKREVRLTFEDYQIYKVKVGNSNINLAYDRGIMLTYGFDTGTDVMFEVINGTGLGGANEWRNFDNDKYKSVFGRVTQDISDFLRVGVCGYMGNENLEGLNDNMITNEVKMFGPDVTLNFEDIVELNIQYLQRTDAEVKHTDLIASDTETKGLMAELIYTPQKDESKWYGVGIFNWVDSDLAYLNYKTASAHLGYLLTRNIRLVSEITYNFTNKYMQAGIGFVSAF
ncbi:hypothetical protein ACFLTH_03320 [Bacteroidota bacterium]